jgi:small subunit ribosomal protein S24e
LEIIERKENALLGRVEITFTLNHANAPTPSLSKMIDMVMKLEPGSKKDLIYIKNVNTRFGMPKTNGLALIYQSEDVADLEPDYIKSRHDIPEASGTEVSEGGDE